MLVERVTKETADVVRVSVPMLWWLDSGEVMVPPVQTSVMLGSTGWSEAPFPPPGSPDPYDPTPLIMHGAAIDVTGTTLEAYLHNGTPGNVYTCQLLVTGKSSLRKIALEIGVQVSGEPPDPPIKLPEPPGDQKNWYLSLAGGTMEGPLYLARPPQLPSEAATKAYVDGGRRGAATSGMAVVSKAPPPAPTIGDLWYDTEDSNLFIWLGDLRKWTIVNRWR